MGDSHIFQNSVSSSRIVLHGDDDFSSGVSLFEIPDGFGYRTQRLTSVYDRCYLAGFKKLFKKEQVILVYLRQPHETDLLVSSR